MLKTFIPKGYAILDTAFGDFNADTFTDAIVILKDPKEEDSYDLKRPLLILIGQSGGGFTLKGRNDQVVLCKTCGGVWGNPFEGVKVKGRYFSIEHYGGSRYRWSQVVTFKYDPLVNDFVLHRDAGENYDNANPNVVKEVNYRKADAGRILFKNYKNSFL